MVIRDFQANISFNMNQTRVWIFLCLIVLIAHTSSAVRLKVVLRGRPLVEAHPSTSHGDREAREGHDMSDLYNFHNPEHVPGPSHELHPPLNYYSHEVFSAQRSEVPDALDLSIEHFHQQIIPKVLLQTPDSSIVELVEGSGLMIKKERLETIVKEFRFKPTILIPKIFTELLPLEKLARLQTTSQGGFASIPRNMLEGVEAFVKSITEPQINHSHFMRILRVKLAHWRKTYNIQKVSTNIEHRNYVHDLPADSNSMVKLLNEHDVKMDKQMLEIFVTEYQASPSMLLRKLINEIIPYEELITMRVTGRNGNNFVPLRIRNALEDFISKVAKPKLDHDSFINVLKSHLCRLRRKIMLHVPSGTETVINKEADVDSLIEEFIKSTKANINNYIIKKHTMENRTEPKKLIRLLLKELYSIEELKKMYATDYGGSNSIPLNVRDALEDLIGNLFEPRMNHNQFIGLLGENLVLIRKNSNHKNEQQ